MKLMLLIALWTFVSVPISLILGRWLSKASKSYLPDNETLQRMRRARDN